MRKTDSKILAAILGLSLSLLAANATGNGIYKSVDADGNVHYSDRSTKSAEKLKVEALPDKPDQKMAQHRDKRDRLLAVMEEERTERKMTRAEAKKDRAEREANCKKSQADLEQYKTAGYLYRLDENGEREVLEGKEYAGAITQAEDAVNHWCG
jgi:hypothetical protein